MSGRVWVLFSLLSCPPRLRPGSNFLPAVDVIGEGRRPGRSWRGEGQGYSQGYGQGRSGYALGPQTLARHSCRPDSHQQPTAREHRPPAATTPYPLGTWGQVKASVPLLSFSLLPFSSTAQVRCWATLGTLSIKISLNALIQCIRETNCATEQGALCAGRMPSVVWPLELTALYACLQREPYMRLAYPPKGRGKKEEDAVSIHGGNYLLCQRLLSDGLVCVLLPVGVVGCRPG